MKKTVPEALTDRRFWDSYFTKRPIQSGKAVPFAALFDKYLSPNPQKSVLEIGCAGGAFLSHFAEKFKFRAHGVDYSETISDVAQLFKVRGLPDPQLTQTDVFSWKPERQFDLVCSFGFAEHFANLEEVVAVHCALTAPRGRVILSVPNFRRLQFFFHLIVEPKYLKLHNLTVMNPAVVRSAFRNQPFTINYLSYTGVFGLLLAERPAGWRNTAAKLILFSGGFWKRLFRYRPNSWVSPYILCIAERMA